MFDQMYCGTGSLRKSQYRTIPDMSCPYFSIVDFEWHTKIFYIDTNINFEFERKSLDLMYWSLGFIQMLEKTIDDG